MNAWHEQDAWWEAFGGFIFRPDRLEAAPEEVAGALSLAGMDPPLDVLDLPCGVGRHALVFAERGCAVTGVDRTEGYLQQARSSAAERGLDIEFVAADMREFVREAAFDLAVNLFSSFGYFEDPADDLKVLVNFYTSLRPGGALVMDMLSKELVARNFSPRMWHPMEDGAILLEERTVTRDWSWMENRWILVRDGERLEHPFSLRLYSASELKRALHEAGFAEVRCFGDLSGGPYDHTARRLVAVARKAAG